MFQNLVVGAVRFVLPNRTAGGACCDALHRDLRLVGSTDVVGWQLISDQVMRRVLVISLSHRSVL